VICSCYQCDSTFCALHLTALIKPKWCVLLHCCPCLRPDTILMVAGWTTVPRPATNLSILICKSSARTRQSVISVVLKTLPEIRLGIFIFTTSLLHRWGGYIGFTLYCPHTFYNKIAPMAPTITYITSFTHHHTGIRLWERTEDILTWNFEINTWQNKNKK